jgi:hypothetical protein
MAAVPGDVSPTPQKKTGRVVQLFPKLVAIPHVPIHTSSPDIVTGSSFLSFLGGVRLNPLGTSATVWPIVPAQDGR